MCLLVGEMIPTPYVSILHPSRASQVPYRPSIYLFNIYILLDFAFYSLELNQVCRSLPSWLVLLAWHEYSEVS